MLEPGTQLRAQLPSYHTQSGFSQAVPDQPDVSEHTANDLTAALLSNYNTKTQVLRSLIFFKKASRVFFQIQ